MTINDFDMARFLMGDEVEEIYTSAGVMVDPELARPATSDTALVLMRFRNGVIATIDNSRKAVYGYDQRVEILGSGGKIEIGNCYPNQAVVSNGSTVHRDLPLTFSWSATPRALPWNSNPLCEPCLKASQRWSPALTDAFPW